MAKSFVPSGVATGLLKNEMLGAAGSWRAVVTLEGEMWSSVRLDVFPMTHKTTHVTFRNNKGNISGDEDSIRQLGVISPRYEWSSGDLECTCQLMGFLQI